MVAAHSISSRLISVDPSLTCSGWALFSIKNAQLMAVGKLRSLSPEKPLAIRLQDLHDKISKIFATLELGDDDVLICESPTTMRDPRAAFKVEQVRGIFEEVARQRSMRVPGRLNPRTVQYEVMGLRGKQLKREIVKATALSIARTLYGKALLGMGFELDDAFLSRHQDIVDAILIGSLGVTRIQSATTTGVTLEEMFESRPQARRVRVAG
jgi:Holliday junction resolvasome RuvABC endonuclease subunit